MVGVFHWEIHRRERSVPNSEARMQIREIPRIQPSKLGSTQVGRAELAPLAGGTSRALAVQAGLSKPLP